MGNTCASVHVAWKGGLDDAIKAVSRSYGKLGYERAKKAPTEGGKHAILLARPGQSFVSVYDSDNAKLDSGELKDLALGVSKALKTAAVFTSLYDSDSYEFIVFARGKQVDMLLSDEETDSGHFQRLSPKSRATRWSSLFGRLLTVDQIRQAAETETAFADTIVAGLSNLIGLSGGQSQINYQDLLEDKAEVVAEFHFRKKPVAVSDFPAGQIHLRNYFDPDHCRQRAVYPASWPIPVRKESALTWLLLSEGAGFTGGSIAIRVSGPESLVLSRGFINGCKFHNGQIVGPLSETPKLPADTPPEEERERFLESKRFQLVPVDSVPAPSRVYSGEFPHLIIPPMTPERTTQILLVLQLEVEAAAPGEWKLDVSLEPGAARDSRFDLQPVRIAAVERTWVPVVSGLNPRTAYNTSNLSAEPRRANLFLWELNHKQSNIPEQRALDHPAVSSSVAILKDEGQTTLFACKSWLESWLRPLAEQQEGEFRIHAAKRMTRTGHVGKTKKNLPAPEFLNSKLWDQLFDQTHDYQSVIVTFAPREAECPIAGAGLHCSLDELGADNEEYRAGQLAATLTAMRGRTLETLPHGSTRHVSRWVINHPAGHACLHTSFPDMERALDAFAAKNLALLQAWNSQCTWIPAFDVADGYHRTPYEDASLLNWFRGILGTDHGLNHDKMSLAWCSNVLRMVAPQMWLCRNLIDQVDRAALETVAQVTETGGASKVVLRPERQLDDLELALLPILPVESARIRVL